MEIEVVDDYVSQFLLGEVVHDKTNRSPEVHQSIDRCT